MKKRVLSGIRATGKLHLGNYLGAVKGMLELQNNPEYETFYMVVDLHTITTPYKRETLKESVRNIIVEYLACGLDPQKSPLFIQSMVPEHIELAYYFSTVVSVAKLQHLPTFKEKVKQHPEHVTMALLNYPILMASDILIYKASTVPVGIDQEPHIEMTREIARRFNQDFGTDFPEPKRFKTSGEYIPSLTGEGKMAKSVEGSYINLTDSLDEIRKKVRSIPTSTDVGGEMTGGVKNLFTFAELFIPGAVPGYKQQFKEGSLKFVEIKDAVAEAIFKELEPIQTKYKELQKDQAYITNVIEEGVVKARSVACQTIKEVKEKMGLS